MRSGTPRQPFAPGIVFDHAAPGVRGNPAMAVGLIQTSRSGQCALGSPGCASAPERRSIRLWS
jgi:hypothetical protein